MYPLKVLTRQSITAIKPDNSPELEIGNRPVVSGRFFFAYAMFGKLHDHLIVFLTKYFCVLAESLIDLQMGIVGEA